MRRALLLGLCLLPVAFALPSLSDPYGTAEEGLNATIWGLGARNLLELGPTASVRGTLVAPHPGTRGDGIYAHHPPLPVWLMTLPVALGGWEGFSRLLGLACACAALLLLHRLLSRFFPPDVALLAVATAALSTFVLRYGRLFTTLTLAAPLFLLLLDVTLSRERPPRWTWLAVAALVLSSWDGVAAAGLLVGLLTVSAVRDKRGGFAPALAFVACLAFVAWHLVDATHGLAELKWQFLWRASGDEVTWGQWLLRQGQNVGEGVGPLTLLALAVAPIAWWRQDGERRVLVAFALCAFPGLVMELVFRQGAQKHAFWGYNLVWAGAFAVAMLLTLARQRRPWVVAGLAVQAAFCVACAGQRLSEERAMNSVGALAAHSLAGPTVAVLGRSNFHPYLSWYLNARPLTARTLEELEALQLSPELPMLADQTHAAALGCAPLTARDATADGRWVATTAGAVLRACLPSAQQSLR